MWVGPILQCRPNQWYTQLHSGHSTPIHPTHYLYGMWPFSVASALMTSPSADSDLLIACASLRFSPSLIDFFNRSLPARSTKLSLPRDWFCVCVAMPGKGDGLKAVVV